MTMEAGTGANDGFELVNEMDVVVDGADVSWTATHVVLPLVSGSTVNDTDAGVGGAELTVNVPGDDHAVTAAVVGDASP